METSLEAIFVITPHYTILIYRYVYFSKISIKSLQVITHLVIIKFSLVYSTCNKLANQKIKILCQLDR